jgi:hypothetical protein
MSPRRNWDSPNPSLSRVPLHSEPGGGGAHSPAGEGYSQFRRLEKKLSTLPTLWCGVLSAWLLYINIGTGSGHPCHIQVDIAMGRRGPHPLPPKLFSLSARTHLQISHRALLKNIDKYGPKTAANRKR